MAVFDAHKNLAIGSIVVPPTPGTSGNTIAVAAGQGARFPAVPFNATIWPANQPALPTNAEIVRAVNRAGDSFQITRAQEGSTAREVVAGDLIAATITAKTLTDIETVVNQTGFWQDQPFVAAHYFGTAPMTWTIGAAAVVRNRYAIVGKTMFWSVYISWFSGANVLGGTPSDTINLTLPGNFVAAPQVMVLAQTPGVIGIPGINGLYGSTGTGGTFAVKKAAGGNFALTDIPGMIFTVTLEVA